MAYLNFSFYHSTSEDDFFSFLCTITDQTRIPSLSYFILIVSPSAFIICLIRVLMDEYLDIVRNLTNSMKTNDEIKYGRNGSNVTGPTAFYG